MKTLMNGDRVRDAHATYFGLVTPGWKLCVFLGALYLLVRMFAGGES